MADLEQPLLGDSAAPEQVQTVDDQTGDTQDLEQGQDGEATPTVEELEEEIDGVKLRGAKEALERIKAERL